jgi:cell division protein FtsQ
MHQSIDKKNKVVIYLIFLFILSTTSGKFTEKQKDYSLKINKINVEGLSISENLMIQNELNSIFYQNILILGKDKINKIINKYNIIEEYNIKKIYPSKLDVKIKPTKLIAKVISDNQLILGANGKLISNKHEDKIFPHIFGEFNSESFLEFKKSVEISKFDFIEFKTMYFFPSNRWDILTVDNILIKLPQKNMVESLNLAHKIMNDEEFIDKNIIDLRVKNHLIIK